MGEITVEWMRIENWLDRNAPASAAVLAEPARTVDIQAAQRTLELEFPDEVVESLRRHDGLRAWANVLPAGRPLSVAGIVALRQSRMQIAADVDGFSAVAGCEPWWHPLWLPVADAEGDALIVDLRPGRGHGRLGWAVHDDVGCFDDGWPSLGAYLTEAADALTRGGTAHGWRAYLTADDTLWWSATPRSSLHGPPLRPVHP